MYEPIVLKKRQIRALTGTPAAKVFVITNLLQILIPVLYFNHLGNCVVKKKKLIFELEEGYKNKEKTLHDEYFETQDYWANPIFNNIVIDVFEKKSLNAVEGNN
ncbi:hypothetical protein K0M31_000684 [Melipona bicolor]|uniref:Uncharacterized protein n=1 Tax=Melipona bicolor TaxID=60889 RepID=A0AA40KWY8_9HYME|nr:hypothetical protein K0M31_000684 [Melipona bicolor]